MDRKNKELLKEAISNVNRTLSYYEENYISVQRSPWVDKERCKSFKQFIEARFNFELSKIPDFEYLCQVFDGKLFSLDSLEDEDAETCKFKIATFSLIPEETIKEVISPFPEIEDLINVELSKIDKFLGGKIIKFNSVKKKIKIIIEK